MMTDQKEHVAKSTTVVSGATFVSRLFGLVREQIFAFLFGAGFATDAFVAAFRIPNLLRDLFAEGALSAAFVPVFTDYLVNKEKKEAFRLGNLVVNALLVVLFVIVVIGILATPWIVDLIAPGLLCCPLFNPPIIGMALGVLLGGLGQWAFQLPSLRREGYRYRPIVSFSDPGGGRIILLMTPAILGLHSTQINIFVNTIIASF